MSLDIKKSFGRSLTESEVMDRVAREFCGIGNLRLISEPRNKCVKCKAKIPPGKAGRKCTECRKATQ